MQDLLNQRIGDYAPLDQAALHYLRKLVHTVAGKTEGCGSIVEALKWNQVSFLTEKPKSGTTIRFDKNATGSISLYVSCNSNLVADFKQHYPTGFEYVGTREVILPMDLASKRAELKHLIAMALTYHQRKKT